MTAEEIRKLRDESVHAYKIDGSLDERNQLMFFLGEIAAQLAELNERVSPDGRENAFHLTLSYHAAIHHGNNIIEIIDRHRAEGRREIHFDAGGAAEIDAVIAMWKRFIST